MIVSVSEELRDRMYQDVISLFSPSVINITEDAVSALSFMFACFNGKATQLVWKEAVSLLFVLPMSCFKRIRIILWNYNLETMICLHLVFFVFIMHGAC